MVFTIPTQQFDATDHARNKAIRANQFMSDTLLGFIQTYEEYWEVSGSMQTAVDINGNAVLDIYGSPTQEFISDGSRRTVAEMQEALEKL